MVEVLGIAVDRRPKERPHKMGKDHRKNRMSLLGYVSIKLKPQRVE
jgi:hypothetical protein